MDKMDRSFCHIEINTTNLKKAEKFYSDLFGWKIQSQVMPNYSLFETSNPPHGGIAQVERVNPGDGTMFYIQVDNIDKYLSKAEGIGGKKVTPKSEIPNIGWFGVLADPDGNRIGLYTGLPK